jgi:nucleoside-diphosphate-sugar epimerase
MKVLLLGATGNVGSRLIPALIAHKHQVVVYVRSASKLPATATTQLTAVVEGDGTDSDAIKAAILKENCGAVINAAGLAAMTRWHAPSQLPKSSPLLLRLPLRRARNVEGHRCDVGS